MLSPCPEATLVPGETAPSFLNDTFILNRLYTKKMAVALIAAIPDGSEELVPCSSVLNTGHQLLTRRQFQVELMSADLRALPLHSIHRIQNVLQGNSSLLQIHALPRIVVLNHLVM
jgi:hypothetical protein